ncbi:MAG: hypothetical protein ACYTGF_07345 [Planctomycetota bacterium]|jgi:hypothetical protein
MSPPETPPQSSGQAQPPSLSRQGHITDARERTVTQLDPVTMYVLQQHAVIEADVLRAIAHEKGVEMTGWERGSLITGVVALLLVSGLFVQSIIMKDFSNAPFARSAALAYFSFVPWVFWFGLKRARFGKVTAAMLKHGRCPHCGYNLRCLPADEQDGATVCPECGCAWNLTSPSADGHEG